MNNLDKFVEARIKDEYYMQRMTEALCAMGETELLETLNRMPPRLREASLRKQVANLTDKVYKMRKQISELKNGLKKDHSPEGISVLTDLDGIGNRVDRVYRILTNPGFVDWANKSAAKAGKSGGLFSGLKSMFGFDKKSEPENPFRDEEPASSEPKKEDD